jgi:hypothetical protein
MDQALEGDRSNFRVGASDPYPMTLAEATGLAIVLILEASAGVSNKDTPCEQANQSTN